MRKKDIIYLGCDEVEQILEEYIEKKYKCRVKSVEQSAGFHYNFAENSSEEYYNGYEIKLEKNNENKA